MRRIPTIAFACTVIASAASATESLEDRGCNADFAAAARYLAPGSPEWKAMANHSIDLNRKYPEDWTDDEALDTKRRHHGDMEEVLARIKSGDTTIEQVFAGVNACETRLGMPVSVLKVGRQPTD
ncbi:MAG: hypothetical protein JOZ72_03600 [Alphaproteobacteria bacterium]|nr:hypothetical protein [Alphaproteobacteria bacterium]